jgi:hypothetical protein
MMKTARKCRVLLGLWSCVLPAGLAWADELGPIDCNIAVEDNEVLNITDPNATGASGRIGIAGASLFVDFFRTPASTNDWIDADGDGCSMFDSTPTPPCSFVDQLAGDWSPGSPPASTFWEVQYRSVGSINGYGEFLGNQLCGWFSSSVPAEFGLFNRYEYAEAGSRQIGSYADCLSPGGPEVPAPFAVCDDVAAPDEQCDGDDDLCNDGGTPGCMAGIDIAVLDVPSKWGTRVAGAAVWDANPGDSGYGDNTRAASAATQYVSKLQDISRDCDGSGTIDPGESLNFNEPVGNNTIVDTSVAYAPIVYIANRGTAWKGTTGASGAVVGGNTYNLTDMKHLMVSGRRLNGENLATAVRSVGSGTRNGIYNTSGIDPSAGDGDNVNAEFGNSNDANLGPGRKINNCQGSSQTEVVTEWSRLAVGFTGLAGASRAAEDAAAGRYEILDIIFDDRGTCSGLGITPCTADNDSPCPGQCVLATTPIRPRVAESPNPGDLGGALDNCNPNVGYQLGGPVTFVTRGDPQIPAGPGSMQNQAAAAFLNNITASISVFDSIVTCPVPDNLLNMPAEFLSNTFTLSAALDCLPDPNDPSLFKPNPNLNQFLQDCTRIGTTTITPDHAGVNQAGLVPRRRSASPGTYADGQVQNYAYNSAAGVPQTPIANNQKLAQRNRVQGDFNADGQRDVDDIPRMLVALQNPLMFEVNEPGFPLPGDAGNQTSNVVIVHVIGDFDGNGNFDADDVRYFADGLALVPAGPGPGPGDPSSDGGVLDRRQGFTMVDQEWDALTGDDNFFNTVVINPLTSQAVAYPAGGARADVAGLSTQPLPNAHPTGRDGRVDCVDLVYISDNFGDWTNTADALAMDLSCDMNGDLAVDDDDIAEVLVDVMGLSAGNVGAVRAICQVDGNLGSCDEFADCGDLNSNNLRDDPCAWYACIASGIGPDGAGICYSQQKPTSQADIGGANGACQIDGTADGNDRFHALNCFSDLNTQGAAGYPCEPSPPITINVDAGGLATCALDGVCDGADAFHALNSFSNINFTGGFGYPCTCGGPAPDFAGLPLPAEWTKLDLRAPESVRPGERVEVHVHLAGGLKALRGYQLHLGVASGKSGSLELVDISVDGQRGDYAYAGVDGPWMAFNRAHGQMTLGLDAADGAPVAEGDYLATFTYRASSDAAGRFVVEVLYSGSEGSAGDDAPAPGERTFLFGRAAGPVGLTGAEPAIIDVQNGRLRSARVSMSN